MARAHKTTDNDDWRNEDPNLLNIRELLYREAEKLPMPVKADLARELEIRIVRKMVRELILDHNVILICRVAECSHIISNLDFHRQLLLPADELSQKQEGIRASQEVASEVLRKFAEVFNSKTQKLAQRCEELQNSVIWDEENMHEVFSNQGLEKILMWKTTVNQFLECFSTIRKFIPKEALEQNKNAQGVELEKQQLSCLPSIAEELARLQDVLQRFMEA